MVEDIEDPRRTEPVYISDERDMLEAWLEFHRLTLVFKCEGLDAEALKARPVATSMLSLHGLVRHMADVERNWFTRVLLREPETPPLFFVDGVDDRELYPLDESDWSEDLATWTKECELSPRSRSAFRSRPPRRATGQGCLTPVDLQPHDRGVRTSQRSRRPDPRDGRRCGRVVMISRVHSREPAEQAPSGPIRCT